LQNSVLPFKEPLFFLGMETYNLPQNETFEALDGNSQNFLRKNVKLSNINHIILSFIKLNVIVICKKVL